MKQYPRVWDDVKIINIRGPWKTKSDGRLMVLFALSLVDLQNYFSCDQSELRRVPQDIRGLRAYTVRDLSSGKIGGEEFHRIRREMIFGLEGTVKWQCEDVFGDKREEIITPDIGVLVPPFILHTYEVMEENSGLLIVANTLFDPEDSRTWDTEPQSEFRKLQLQQIIQISIKG